MEILFREIDPFNAWIWLRFTNPPAQGEKDYIEGIFDSWYVIGRLGGFNAENLQAQNASSDLSFMNYDNDALSNKLPALMHNLGQLEYKNDWARCWIDIGTSDALALDILINALSQIDESIVEIQSLFVGGVNEDWPVDEHPDLIFGSDD